MDILRKELDQIYSEQMLKDECLDLSKIEVAKKLQRHFLR